MKKEKVKVRPIMKRYEWIPSPNGPILQIVVMNGATDALHFCALGNDKEELDKKYYQWVRSIH